MKLSKLYSNLDDLFQPINFKDSINIVLAEVRNPQNQTKSTHDLGKSLLASLIDYCLLKEAKKGQFIRDNYKKFELFIFFLEIQLPDGRFCTIRRAVKSREKVMIKVHEVGKRNYKELPKSEWDFQGGLEKSIQYLNDLLQFEVLRNRNYRKTLSYFLRDNQSYVDVFQLSKHIGKHINWKPLVIELLGFDTQSVIKKYEIDAEIQRLQEVRNELAKLNDAQAGEAERYRVFLDIKLEELQEKEEEYSRFDFSTSDIEKPKELVQEVDAEITKYINENYYLKKQIENATKSIFDYRIDLKELESFYKEIGLYFEKQLVKEYEDLVAFHYELTEERNEILSEIIEEASSKYNQNVLEISRFNLRRAELLQYLNATDAMEKYKVLQEEIIGLKADILNLQDKIKSLHETHDKDLQIQDLFTKRSQEVYNIRQEIYGKKNTLLTTIKHHFSSIINKSVGDIGIITLDINKNDNVDIKPEIVDQDTKSKGNKGDGTTYKKLMCAAFDLALLATYSPMKYFKFVYHDGIFDGLDNRQKNNFYRVIQKYVSKYNIQYIFTAIQDELPPEINSENTIEKLKEEGTIIRVLHDDGNEGRLFNMPPF